MSVLRVILVRIFPNSDWVRRDISYVSVFSPNAGKFGPEQLQIRTLFAQQNTLKILKKNCAKKRSFLLRISSVQISSHLLKKSVMENFIFKQCLLNNSSTVTSTASTLTWHISMAISWILKWGTLKEHTLFYKQLGSYHSPQSCFCFQDFQLDGCLVVWPNKQILSILQWFYSVCRDILYTQGGLSKNLYRTSLVYH